MKNKLKERAVQNERENKNDGLGILNRQIRSFHSNK